MDDGSVVSLMLLVRIEFAGECGGCSELSRGNEGGRRIAVKTTNEKKETLIRIARCIVLSRLISVIQSQR